MEQYNQTFTHDGRTFNIRVAEINNEYIVQVFLEDKSLVKYCITIETERDYRNQHQESFIKNLVSLAKSDVEAGITHKTS